jgi:hypothetical protein
MSYRKYSRHRNGKGREIHDDGEERKERCKKGLERELAKKRIRSGEMKRRKE